MPKGWPERYEQAASVLSFIANVFAIVGIPIGFLLAGWEIRIRKSTDYLGPFCLNEQQMGFFVVQGPSPLKYFWRPWAIKPTPPPRLLTVSSLIKAGDDGIFTSAMFNRILPNHQALSWRPFYETFFCEYVWWSQKHGYNPRDGREVEDIRRFLRKAEKSVRDIKSDPSTAYHTELIEYGLGRYPLLRELLLAIYRLVERLLACVDYYSTQSDRKNKTDPHLLSMPPPRHISSRIYRPIVVDSEGGVHGTDVRSRLQPKLITSQRLLQDPTPQGNGQQSKESKALSKKAPRWSCDDDTKEIWIHSAHPSVEVSKEELSALSFIMGIPLHTEDRNFLPQARGAYGITLTSEKIDKLTTFSFVYGPRTSEPAMGSGYSALFAKQMACGCLPFAKVSGVIQTISITDAVKEHLKNGGAISDETPEEPVSSSAQYLNRLPSSASNNFYRNRILISVNNQGDLLRSGSGRDLEHVSFWWEAVAGIAFGGLVPMATRNLKEIVRFTIEGTLKCPELEDGFGGLEGLAAKLHGNLSGETALKVFGSKIGTRLRNVRYVEDSEDRDTRILVETLNRYTTVLERLMALAAPNLGFSPEKMVDEVYKRLGKKLESSYQRAVINHGLDESGESTGSEFTVEQWITGERGIPSRVDGNQIDVEDCAKVAMWIIAAWTRLARTVRWKDHDFEAGGTNIGTASPHLQATGMDSDAEDIANTGALHFTHIERQQVMVAELQHDVVKETQLCLEPWTKARQTNDLEEAEYSPPLLRELPDVSAWY